MSDEEEDLGSMAWPGFVDILSSVIIMFVFFVLIVASALYFHIIIFKNKILSELNEYTQASATAKELADTNRFLMEKIDNLENKLKVSVVRTEENEIQLYQVNTEFSETIDQEVDELENEDGVVIFFGKDSISVTEENRLKVIDLIRKKSSNPNVRVKIIASKNPDSLNDVVSRKLAVSRMLNVRNLFLEGEIPIENVSPKTTEGFSIGDSYHWVKIIFEGK
ncbi:MAG: hypothetical protein ACRBB3_01445 [Alphaproteobacteria bacterium]